jgi:hypothetical protein
MVANDLKLDSGVGVCGKEKFNTGVTFFTQEKLFRVFVI